MNIKETFETLYDKFISFSDEAYAKAQTIADEDPTKIGEAREVFRTGGAYRRCALMLKDKIDSIT